MKVNRLTAVLILVCVGLGLWVAYQSRSLGPGKPEDAGPSSAVISRGSGVTAPKPPPMPPLASYNEITERPVFDPARRPPPEAETAARAKPPPPGNYRLEGTAVTPGGQVAVVRNTRTSELHRLAVGESVDGWQLDEVAPGSAALSQGRQKIQLELERPPNTPVR